MLASNEGYFPGLACAVLSILSATEPRGGITFHILDGGIDEASWRSLESRLSSAGEEVRLQRRPLSFARFAGLPLDYGNSVMTYARLLMPTLIDEDEVIYVDSDILCFRDLRDLWQEPLGDNLVAACQDPFIKLLARDSLFELAAEQAGTWYFNAGLLKVNLKLWRHEDVQGQVLRLVRDHREKCTWWDQTALNSCVRGRVKYIDSHWNRNSFEVFSLGDFKERINVHYVSKIKPWMSRDSKNVGALVWRLFRAKFMPAAGRPSGLLQSFHESCYDAALHISSRWGGIGIRVIDRFVRLFPSKLRWLENQRTKLEILAYLGSRWNGERDSRL